MAFNLHSTSRCDTDKEEKYANLQKILSHSLQLAVISLVVWWNVKDEGLKNLTFFKGSAEITIYSSARFFFNVINITALSLAVYFSWALELELMVSRCEIEGVEVENAGYGWCQRVEMLRLIEGSWKNVQVLVMFSTSSSIARKPLSDRLGRGMALL